MFYPHSRIIGFNFWIIISQIWHINRIVQIQFVCSYYKKINRTQNQFNSNTLHLLVEFLKTYFQMSKKSQQSNSSLQNTAVPNVQQQSKKNKILLGIFLVGVIGFIVLIYNRPQFSNPQVFENLSFPPTPHDLYNISKVLSLYAEEHFYFSIFAFVYLYILLQAFAIPGPVFLCILSSTLYGPIGGFFLSLSCSCLGASLCFFLSYSLAKELVLRKFPALFQKFDRMVRSNEKNLFWYMMFLRLTPLIPNWFVNLASPLVGMPYIYFIIASFFGLMPNNFILIQTGLTLKQIDKIGVSPKAFVTLLVLACLSLIPTFIGKKYQKKLQKQQYSQLSTKQEQEK